MDIKLRRYKDSDYEVVSDIIYESFKTKKEIVDVPEYIHEYVCLIDEEIVGYFIFTDIVNAVHGYHYYLLDYVCVSNKCRGMGIGTKMINEAINIAKENKVNYIRLTSNSSRVAARKMYKSLGFLEEDTNVFRLVIE